MEYRAIRKVRIQESPDVLLRVKVYPEGLYVYTSVGTLSLSRLDLIHKSIRLGGLASILGGVLWIVLFLFLQFVVFANDFYSVASLPVAQFVRGILYFVHFPRVEWSVVSMLLLLVGLVGLYVYQSQTPSMLLRVGAFLCFIGLCLATISTSGYQGGPEEPFRWYHGGETGQFILCIGLVLFGIAIIRSRALPAKGAILLIASALLMQLIVIYIDFFVVPEYLSLLLSYLYVPEWINQFGIFTIPALLFGASWVWLGRALLSETSRAGG